MATPVYMPKQGQSVESCILTEWYKNKGDSVEEGEPLFAYETDKASFDYEAEAEGILLVQFFKEMDEVPVLTNVAVIGQEGEPTDEYNPHAASGAAQKPERKAAVESREPSVEQETQEETQPQPQQARDEPQQVRISPRAKKLADKHKILYSNIKGTGPYGRIIERDIEQAIATGPKATRLAYQTSQEKAVASQEGTGIGGRVTDKDLAAANRIYAQDYETRSLTNIRKLIASSMHASLQNSAQLTHHTSADARNILALRKQVKARRENTDFPNITLNDMVSFALIRALKQHPDANAHFGEDHIKVFHKVHLGFAVDAARGLIVPVVRNADDLSLAGLSRQMKALAEQAHKGSIDPELIASKAASFTISNLGAYGVEMFTPVLNLPQVGILGVNTIINRPADLGKGTFGFIPYIGLSLTYDHRAIDGGPASLFLKTVKEEIEQFPVELPKSV